MKDLSSTYQKIIYHKIDSLEKQQKGHLRRIYSLEKYCKRAFHGQYTMD